MIKSGQKTEEYRDLKKHYSDRLISEYLYVGYKKGVDDFNDNPSFRDFVFRFKEFETVTFSNGYQKNRDQFTIELKKIDVRTGNCEWGAENGKRYFVLILGKILT